MDLFLYVRLLKQTLAKSRPISIKNNLEKHISYIFKVEVQKMFFRACERSRRHILIGWLIRGANHWTKNKNGDRSHHWKSPQRRGVDKPDFHGQLILSPQKNFKIISRMMFSLNILTGKFLCGSPKVIISLREATRVKRRGALIFQRESHAADLITIGAERMKDAAPQPKHIFGAYNARCVKKCVTDASLSRRSAASHVW